MNNLNKRLSRTLREIIGNNTTKRIGTWVEKHDNENLEMLIPSGTYDLILKRKSYKSFDLVTKIRKGGKTQQRAMLFGSGKVLKGHNTLEEAINALKSVYAQRIQENNIKITIFGGI